MTFFCEYHGHVRAVHIAISLPSPPDDLTTLEIFDRKTLRLRHAFQSYSIPLPASIKPEERLAITTNGLTLTCRVPATPIVERSTVNQVPWSSQAQLCQDLRCACGVVLVNGNEVDWRHLPSEHWLEMMDSWHCHRGVTDEHHNQHHDQYALPDHIISATERIRPRPGIGLIGLSYLLLHTSQRTPKVKTSLSLPAPREFSTEVSLHCDDCGNIIGTTSTVSPDEFRLDKCALSPQFSRDTKGGQGRIRIWTLVAEMLEIVEAHATHRFLIHPLPPRTNSDVAGREIRCPDDDDDDDEGKQKKESGEGGAVVVWMLTVDARVTGTTVSLASPGRRVVKVMYRRATAADLSDDPVSPAASDAERHGTEEMERIAVQERVMQELWKELGRHHEVLGRERLKEWRSSFLDRYEAAND